MNEGKKTITITIDYNLWRAAREKGLNISGFLNECLKENTKKGETRETKAIIIAAGMSSRLLDLTDEKPKCMLEIGNKTLLQRQIEIFHQCGIDKIVVIRGYKKEKINYTGVKYVYNKNYRRNNILESLMSAESEMDGEFICSYSDILYQKKVVEKLLKSKRDISLIVDTDWAKQYKDRLLHPVEEAENAVVENGKVVKIGKSMDIKKVHGEFIGLAKFSKKGAETLKKEYGKLRKRIGINAPFHKALSLERAYLTDMIQELIDKGNTVSNVDIEGCWMELDTIEDFRKAEKMIKW